MTVILEYICFHIDHVYSSHVILHLPAKFCSNRTHGGGVMASSRFFKMADIESIIYFQVQFKEVKIFAYQISTKYLNPRLR